MLAEAQRDLTAEQAAQQLRDLPDIQYLESGETYGVTGVICQLWSTKSMDVAFPGQ